MYVYRRVCGFPVGTLYIYVYAYYMHVCMYEYRDKVTIKVKTQPCKDQTFGHKVNVSESGDLGGDGAFWVFCMTEIQGLESSRDETSVSMRDEVLVLREGNA